MHKKHLRTTLVLSMFAAVAAMAVGASAAQAKWLIKVGGVSVLSAKFQGAIGSGEALIPGLGLEIRCTGGTVQVAAQIVESGEKLIGSGGASVTGCVVVGAEKTCTVEGGGGPGVIVGKGSGEGEMEGSKYFATIESSEFAFIEISGGLCPLNETSGEVSGGATATLANAEIEQKAHTVELADVDLFFGEEPATLHDGINPNDPIKGNGEEASGKPWAIQLVGL